MAMMIEDDRMAEAEAGALELYDSVLLALPLLKSVYLADFGDEYSLTGYSRPRCFSSRERLLAVVAGCVAGAKGNGTTFDEEWEKYKDRSDSTGDIRQAKETETELNYATNGHCLAPEEETPEDCLSIADAAAELEARFADPEVWAALLALAKRFPTGVEMPGYVCRQIYVNALHGRAPDDPAGLDERFRPPPPAPRRPAPRPAPPQGFDRVRRSRRIP
jgi:hypothetical protein